MQDKSKKDASLPDSKKAVDKKVEVFMGGPPPDEKPKDEVPVAGTIIQPGGKNLPGPPPVGAKAKQAEQPTKPKPPVQSEEETVPDDSKTVEAIEDIAAKDSDAILAAEDAVAKAFEPKPVSRKEKFKKFLRRWWDNPKARWATIIGTVLLIVAVILTPLTRYFILNAVGIRSSSSLTVLDDSTGLPLKNVQVTLAGQTNTTDQDGKAKLSHLKLGSTNLVIQKTAFATQNKKVTLGWGSNPLGSFTLKAVGAQYSFVVQDWLSGKPLEKAEAISGDANAQSDKDGKILLTVDTAGDDKLTVTVKAQDYRDETFDIPLTDKDSRTIKMVPVRKEVFVSKRSGKYDLYKIDVDGKNEEIVLKGTGFESGDIALVPHPTAEEAALVSTRDNAHNKDGYLLSTLSLINLKDNSMISLGQSERIQIVGWISNRLVYVQVAAGASAANPKRNRLMSYDYKTEEKKELASSNSFNDVLIASDNIYYAPASYLANQGNIYLFKVNADGTNQQTILNKEVWNIMRAGYDEFNLSVGQDWYKYKLGDQTATKLSAQPNDLKNRVYADSPDKKRSLWADNRDGKGVLLAYNIDEKTDKVLRTQSGLKYPVRWLTNNTVIYRVQTSQETADYVLNIDGGEPKKIKDVTDIVGLAQWYYY
jgi:hypothetical protein